MSLCRQLAVAVRGEQQFEVVPSSPPATRRLQIAGTGSNAEFANFGGAWALSPFEVERAAGARLEALGMRRKGEL